MCSDISHNRKVKVRLINGRLHDTKGIARVILDMAALPSPPRKRVDLVLTPKKKQPVQRFLALLLEGGKVQIDDQVGCGHLHKDLTTALFLIGGLRVSMKSWEAA